MSNSKKYTADDVKLYLEGKLSPAQMHELEKAALDDPFLADALEGMQSYGNAPGFTQDVADLKSRLDERVNRKRNKVAAGTLWMKIAAVLFIVVTGVAIIIITGKKNEPKNTTLAVTQKQQERDGAAMSERDTVVLTDSSNDVAVTPRQTPPVQTSPLPRPPAPKQSFRKKVQEEKPLEHRAPQQADQAQTLSEVDIPEAVKKEEAANAEVTRALEGRVAGVDITNSSDTNYDEVIVVGHGITRSNQASRVSSAPIKKSRNVLPAYGWDRFHKYVSDSLNISTSDSTLNGEEHVSFTISDDGTPESIKILKSLSPAHDKETINILQNGPTWKVLKGGNRNITLKLIF